VEADSPHGACQSKQHHSVSGGAAGLGRGVESRTIMLIESIQKSSDAVIPQLNEAIMEGGKNPGPLGVKAQALHSIALRFELC
jgi:hypothetical protein